MKLLSDPKIRMKTLQYTARLKGMNYPYSKPDKRIIVHFTQQKILLNLPFMKVFPQRGDMVEVEGIFMELPYEKSKDYAIYLKSRSIGAIFEGHSRGFAILKNPNPYFITALSNKLKSYVKRVNSRLLLWPQSEFVTALFTGNRDNLPRSVIESFKRSGTMHILAVSGLHIGFLIFFFFLFFKILRVNQIVSYIILIGIVTFYMIFIGDSPSVKRASLMVLCGIGVFLYDRDRDYLNILSITFNILWVSSPLIIINPGFMLSFSATFAILFLVPYLKRFFESIMPSFLAASLSVSAGVQVYLLPVMLSFFGSFSYINIIANLPIVPLAGLSLALEILCLIFYSLFLPLAVIFAEVNIVIVAIILRLAHFFSRVPPITVQGVPIYIIPFYFLAVTAGIWLLFKRADT